LLGSGGGAALPGAHKATAARTTDSFRREGGVQGGAAPLPCHGQTGRSASRIHFGEREGVSGGATQRPPAQIRNYFLPSSAGQ
jgi:hypothetical protein